MNFVLSRKQEYKNSSMTAFTWPLRGVGYLYEQHGIVLAGNYVKRNDTHSVHIYDVQETKFNCSDIFIWVRVNGTKEIFAGQAQAVFSSENEGSASVSKSGNDECHWEFDFEARTPGSYSIDAKLIEWKPHVLRPVQCPPVTNNASIVAAFPIKKSFLGFKMYSPTKMCCEICSRLAGHCKAWSTPIPSFPRGEKLMPRNGCELYFDSENSLGLVPVSPSIAALNKTNNTEYDIAEEERSEKMYSLPHHSETSYFLGCGWSYWFTLDFPCISGDIDDNVFFTDNTVNLTATDMTTELNEGSILTLNGQANVTVEKYLCPIESESFSNHSGRWVREPWPTDGECHPYETIDKPLTQYGYADGSISKINGSDNPECYRRDDHMHAYDQQCLEMNCMMIRPSSQWKSWLHEEKQWSGHWKHDSDCSYSEFTDVELQQCINRRKLYGFEIEGSSIAEMIRGYMNQRLENITLYNDTELGDGTKVTISNFSILHYCYLLEVLKDKFENAPNITENEELFWVSGYFLSSEQEIMCFNSRIKDFSLLGGENTTCKRVQDDQCL